MSVNVDGIVEPGFEGVRDAFLRNFTEHGDIGAGFAAYVGGRKVVDLWGGVADPTSDRPYDESTLQLVFSTTKGATAACANLLAQRGQLDIEAPVATYWPEFGGAGKEQIPVRMLLTHQAGLPVIDAKLSLEEALEWTPVAEALAAQAPVWEPGTAHGYHAVTYGYLVGEVVRRITGQSLGTFFREEFAEPLGLEFWIGLPDSEQERVAPIAGSIVPQGEVDEATRAMLEQFIGPDTLLGRALSMNGVFAGDCWNRADVRAAEVPAANGVTNARSLARFYAGLVGSLPDAPVAPVLSREVVDEARRTRTSGADRVLFFETTFGLGFMTSSPFAPYGGAGSFGHAGAGGSVGFGDPDNGIACGYVMNKMAQNLSGDPRTRGLIKATYEAAGAPIAHV